jgi:hypothetical protein
MVDLVIYFSFWIHVGDKREREREQKMEMDRQLDRKIFISTDIHTHSFPLTDASGVRLGTCRRVHQMIFDDLKLLQRLYLIFLVHNRISTKFFRQVLAGIKFKKMFGMYSI